MVALAIPAITQSALSTATTQRRVEPLENELANAAFHGDIERVSALLDKGVDKDATSPGRTPLLSATIYGRIPVIKLLLERGANPDIATHLKRTALIVAAHSSATWTPIVKLLLAYKANPDLFDQDGKTALHYAAQNNFVAITQELLKAKPNPFLEDKNYKTPLDYAKNNQQQPINAYLHPRRTRDQAEKLLQKDLAEANTIVQALEEYQEKYKQKHRTGL